MENKNLPILLGSLGVLFLLLMLFFPRNSAVEKDQDKRFSGSVKESPTDGAIKKGLEGNATGRDSLLGRGGSGAASTVNSPLLSLNATGTEKRIGSTASAAIVDPETSESAVADSRKPEKGGSTAISVDGSSGEGVSVTNVSNGQSTRTGSSVNLKSGGSDSGGGAANGASGGGGDLSELAQGLSFGKTGSPGRQGEAGEKAMLKQVFSEEEAQEFRRQRAEIRSRISAMKRSWVSGRAGNSSLEDKTQARYQLKLIEGYAAGNKAFNDKNWTEAVKAYMDGVKDPDATSLTRYLCFENMSMAARSLKDYDLYLEILKEQGKLIAEEDLSVLGIKKDNAGMDFYNEKRRYVEAIRDSSDANITRLVDEIMREEDIKEEDRAETEEYFRESYKEWQEFFEQAG